MRQVKTFPSSRSVKYFVVFYVCREFIGNVPPLKSTVTHKYVRWPTRAIHQYIFQYKNIYSSTTIYIQYNNIHFSSGTEFQVPVQKYIFEYKNMYCSTKIYVLVQKCIYKELIWVPVQKYSAWVDKWVTSLHGLLELVHRSPWMIAFCL